MTTKLKLRAWLTLDEAAQLLSRETKDPWAPRDVLRVGLDGQLELSVDLPQDTAAECWALPPTEDSPDDPTDSPSVESVYSTDPDLKRPQGIAGVWNLPLLHPARAEIESRFDDLGHEPKVKLPVGDRPLRVVRGRVVCELPLPKETGPSSPASLLPAGSRIGVRTALVLELASRLTSQHPGPGLPVKPLRRREAPSLPNTINALAKRAKITIPANLEDEDKIALLVKTLGVTVPVQTPQPELTLDQHTTLLLMILAALMKKAGIDETHLTTASRKISTLAATLDPVSPRAIEDHMKRAIALRDLTK
jgi:hypothetical protein